MARRYLAAVIPGLLLLAAPQIAAAAKPHRHEAPGHRKQRELRRDTDRDGLSNWAEVHRYRTNPRLADTDGDGLSDGVEVKVTRTNPRRADSDGDGFSDGQEILLGSNPWDPASVPSLPLTTIHPLARPPDTSSPDTSIDSGPSGTTISTSASFSFHSTDAGATFECRLDGAAFGPCASPKSYAGLSVGAHSFAVRATGAAGGTDPTPATRAWTVVASPPPDELPQANWTAPADAQVGVPVTLDGSGSTGEAPLACTWSFENQAGDTVFQERSGCMIEFTFGATGTKYVRLEVRSGDGGSDSNRQSFVVAPPPVTEPPPPPPHTTPPETTKRSAPPSSTTGTSASISFSSSEAGSTFECELDGAAFAPCTSPQSYTGLSVGSHSFAVRATDSHGNVDPSPASASWTVESAPPPPPFGCVTGATEATTAAQVRSAVQGGHDVCVIAGVGDVDLEGLGSRSVAISTEGDGSMGGLNINGTTDLTIRNARFRSVELWSADGTTIEGSVIGGTASNRTTDPLININVSPDVTIRGNELAWTAVGGGSIDGYGIRSPGNSLGYNDRLKIEGNYIHNLGSDGIQGFGRAKDVVIDRNRIDYVAATPGSGSHSDGMQIISHGPNMQITNNWISHEGYYAEGQIAGSSGTTYVHGDENGNEGALLIENNLYSDSRGRVEICGLGTGGSVMSNVTIRRNTFSDLGQAYNSFPGFEWDCDSGSNDTITRNIAVDPDGGLAQDGFSSAIVDPNLWGQESLVTLDANGNCTSTNCNPGGQEPIGYRKPSGVSW
jgi:hypothetical protein